MEEAALLVDTTNPPPFYNFFDLISFSFERCVVESIRHTEARLPPRIVNSWVFTEVSEQEAEKLWKKHPCYKNSGKRLEDYVAFVSRDLHVEKTDFRGFTPRHTVVLLQYLMNISNNIAILTHPILPRITAHRSGRRTSRCPLTWLSFRSLFPVCVNFADKFPRSA